MGAGAAGSQICSLWTRRILDLVVVAFGDEQAGRGPVHLDHRVVGGGGAVHQDVGLVAELAQAQAELLGQLPEPRHDPSSDWSFRVEGVLSSTTSPVGDRDEVGERAPDVDAYAVTVNHGVGPKLPCRLVVDGQRQVLQRAGEDHAVVPLGAGDADVLVEDVVEHGLGIAVQGVTQPPPPP